LIAWESISARDSDRDGNERARVKLVLACFDISGRADATGRKIPAWEEFTVAARLGAANRRIHKIARTARRGANGLARTLDADLAAEATIRSARLASVRTTGAISPAKVVLRRAQTKAAIRVFAANDAFRAANRPRLRIAAKKPQRPGHSRCANAG
jgi:hypothetical protein